MAQPARRNQVSAAYHLPSEPQGTVSQPTPLLDQASCPDAGLMILSSSMRILHINERARALMALFGGAYECWPHLSPESMPAILTEFCSHLLAELRRHAGSQKWVEFELRRVCHMVTPLLLLRGFGMPGTDGQEPRMILTLQPCAPSANPTTLRSRLETSTASSNDPGPSTH